MNARKIVEQYLKDNGYDGLFSDYECGCKIGDLMPCDGSFYACEPGYKVPCDPLECCEGHEFHIGPERPSTAPRPRLSDKELLDFLQKLTDTAQYSGMCILRDSTTGRGWRLLETSWEGSVPSVRQAITNYIDQSKPKYIGEEQ